MLHFHKGRTKSFMFLTSLKHGCRDPGSNWSPYNGIRHGYSHISVPLYTDGCLTHTHSHLDTERMS